MAVELDKWQLVLRGDRRHVLPVDVQGADGAEAEAIERPLAAQKCGLGVVERRERARRVLGEGVAEVVRGLERAGAQ